MKKKIVALLSVAVLLLTLVPAAALAAPAQGLTEVKISADKTAMELGNGEYRIKFTIPGETAVVKPVIDVVFVLDISSTADSAFKTNLLNMLNELAANTSEVTYKVGVVMFDRNVRNTSGGLVNIETAGVLQTLMDTINATGSTGGTNLQGGVMLGRSWLDGDTAVAASNKYLIVLSDLRAYLFTRTPGGALEQMYNVNGAGGAGGRWVYDGLARYGYDAAGTYNVASIDNLVRNMIIPKSGMTVANAAWLTALDDTGSIFADDAAAAAAVAAGTALVPSAASDTTVTSFDKVIYLVGNDFLDMKSAGYNEYLLYSPWHGAVDNHGSLYKAFSEWFAQYIGPKYSSDSSAVGDALTAITSDIINSVHMGTLTDVINTTNFTFKTGSFALSYGGTALTATDLGNGSFGYGTPTNGVYPFVAAINTAADTVTLQINVPVRDNNRLEFSFIEKYIEGSLLQGGTVFTNNEAFLEYMNTSEYKTDPTAYRRYMSFPSPSVTITSNPKTGDSGSLWSSILLMTAAGACFVCLAARTQKKGKISAK